jgi:hypothetical protein
MYTGECAYVLWKCYAIFYKGLEHPWVLESTGSLETSWPRYPGSTVERFPNNLNWLKQRNTHVLWGIQRPSGKQKQRVLGVAWWITSFWSSLSRNDLILPMSGPDVYLPHVTDEESEVQIHMRLKLRPPDPQTTMFFFFNTFIYRKCHAVTSFIMWCRLLISLVCDIGWAQWVRMKCLLSFT